MNPVKTVTGTALPLMIDDIDTDRIIPARFLRCVTFDGIGEFAFYDERFNPKGKPTEFPMNRECHKNASIIVAGANFGCGSSREHAPQSLKRAGFNAVIAESFAEIFFGNSLTIGLACLTMASKDIQDLTAKIQETPCADLTISLETKVVEFMGSKYNFNIPEIARTALLDGTYDLLAELLRNKSLTAKVAESLPY